MRHAIPARSFEKLLLLPGSVILLSSDFPFGTFGRAYRTMSFWLNAVVPADHRRQTDELNSESVETRFRFCARCGCQDRRACTHHQNVYKPERFPRRATPQFSAREFKRLPLRVHTFLAVPLHDAWAVDLPADNGTSASGPLAPNFGNGCH